MKPEAEESANRLWWWIAQYGHIKQPEFIADLKAVLEHAFPEQPQPAEDSREFLAGPKGVEVINEDPDEWVIQDRVPVRIGDRAWWVNAVYQLPASPEQMQVVDISDEEFEKGLRHGSKHPRVANTTLHVMCRRRDLPKVEQVEQWPKYYKSPNGIVERGTAETCVHTTSKGESGVCDWLKVYDQYVTDGDWKQITEAEAMALLNKPEPQPQPQKPISDESLELIVHLRDQMQVLANRVAECERVVFAQTPQPQKTRVRLWMRNEPKGRPSLFACDERPYPHKYVEIHHDSEGFYTID